MPTTTVEVTQTTARLLEEIKRKYKTKSYDETIRRLIDKAENIPESMFGAHPKMKSFTKCDESDGHEVFKCVIDSYTWIEYKESFAREKARTFTEGGLAATSVITLAELQEKYLREKWESFEIDRNFIIAKTALIPIDRNISLLAGKINYQNKKQKKDWGMADSIILATARISSAIVVTVIRTSKGSQKLV